MICRIWRGWTMPQNAAAYEDLLVSTTIPGIEALGIISFRDINMMRRDPGEEAEFATIMWFDDLAVIWKQLERELPAEKPKLQRSGETRRSCL